VSGGIDFGNLLVVMALAAAIPLILGLVPRIPVPDSVVEIGAGILVGPAVLGWVDVDQVIGVLARLGVAFLLFLAGLEIDFRMMRGRPLRLGVLAFCASLLLGLLCTLPLGAAGVIIDPAFITVVLSSTSLGIVVPVLKDAGQLDTRTGRFVVAACSVAEFGSIVALSMFFSRAGSPELLETVLKLGVLGIVVAVIGFASTHGGAWRQRIDNVLFRLQDTSAQLRVRIGVLLLVALVVLADRLAFDTILGAFLAGALIASLSEPRRDDEFGNLRHKLEALGFGFFVPVFFVSTGLMFPLDELLSNTSALLRIPCFVGLFLVVRGLPALLLRHDIDRASLLPAAFLQATSLSFVVVAAAVGQRLGDVRPINAASLVAAGMISVLLFPAGALALLRRREPSDAATAFEAAGEE
jgi:Kef-type K+ transport system membrane component KefB